MNFPAFIRYAETGGKPILLLCGGFLVLVILYNEGLRSPRTNLPTEKGGSYVNYNRGYCSLRESRGAERAGKGPVRSDSGDELRRPSRTDRESLAMVYSPVQKWGGIYSLSEALRTGTVFRSLDLPFAGSGRRSGCL